MLIIKINMPFYSKFCCLSNGCSFIHFEWIYFKSYWEKLVVQKNFFQSPADICFGCRDYIFDKHLLRVGGGQSWHINCLRCHACKLSLGHASSCYVKDDLAHCKSCYQRFKNFFAIFYRFCLIFIEMLKSLNIPLFETFC